MDDQSFPPELLDPDSHAFAALLSDYFDAAPSLNTAAICARITLPQLTRWLEHPIPAAAIARIRDAQAARLRDLAALNSLELFNRLMHVVANSPNLETIRKAATTLLRLMGTPKRPAPPRPRCLDASCPDALPSIMTRAARPPTLRPHGSTSTYPPHDMRPQRLAPLVPIRLSGPGLFSGRVSNLTITGPMGRQGLWFEREDLQAERCRATTDALSASPIHPAFASLPPRSTTLQTPSGALVATVEHVLSALDALGFTDAMLELSAPEVPFLDGSAQPFVQMLDLTDPGDDGPLDILTLPHSIRVVDDRDPAARIIASPRAAPGRSFRYDLDYTTLTGPLAADAAALGRQSATWDGTPESYATDIAPARTFCLKGEYDAMRAAGLLANIPHDTAVVFGPAGPTNTTLRLPDEPARHKLLDLIGDLALIGARVQMDVHATKSGHALNHRLARAIRAAITEKSGQNPQS